MDIVVALLLLLTANGAPVIACFLLGDRASWPLDGGVRFFDKQPLFGETKTWRGVGAALTGCALLAVALGKPALLGIEFAAFAMLGDLLSSFSKRRLHIAPSGRATGLDQIPETLLPLLLLRQELTLSPIDIVVVVSAFFVLEQGLSRLLYRWHVRNRPY